MLGGQDPFDFDAVFSPDRNLWRRWRRFRSSAASKGAPFELAMDGVASAALPPVSVGSVGHPPAPTLSKDQAVTAQSARRAGMTPAWVVAGAAALASAGGALFTGQSPACAAAAAALTAAAVALLARGTGPLARWAVAAICVACAVAAPVAWMAAPPVAAGLALFTRARASKGVTSRSDHRHVQESPPLEAGS